VNPARLIAASLLLLVGFCALPAQAADSTPHAEPRIIIGLYADPNGVRPETYRLFRAAELPLNYLGLVLEPHNVAKDVPTLGARDDVRGVLIWLEQTGVSNSAAIVKLMREATQRNIPVVLLEQVPGAFKPDGSEGSLATASEALGLLGIRDLGGYRPYTFDTKIASIDKTYMEFERRFTGPLPPTQIYAPIADGQPLLTLQRADGTRTSPVIVTPKGAFVANDYAVWTEPGDGSRLQWYVNPFALFAHVFKTDMLPKPDPTTLSGRRVYYSQIDGDGWRNITLTEKYRDQRKLSSDVVRLEAIAPYPDLPVSVAPIAADLDPKFFGTPEDQDVARALFALTQVEAGTHTYTHPFQWSYFRPEFYSAKDEQRYAPLYARPIFEAGYDQAGHDVVDTDDGIPLEKGYTTPRAYGDIPFNLDKEVSGSTAFISQFLPPGKKVRVLQWSGDNGPYPQALAAVKKAGLDNINGGDSRRDANFPSYTSVAPYGRISGGLHQIYAGAANEDLFTFNWTSFFAGFRQVLTTIANTDKPRRVSAADVYYHMYSGERDASINALKDVLNAMSRQELAPVATSRYSQIAQGFYSAQLQPIAPNVWRVVNQGALQTLRFDNAQGLSVDYAKSDGILGDRHVGDVLYVTLDSGATAPVIAVTASKPPAAAMPILSDARWEIWSATRSSSSVAFRARGYGPGEMRWRTAPGERWGVTADYGNKTESLMAQADASGLLHFTLPRGAENGITVSMTKSGG
jgi:hypothetical protein